MSTCFYGCGWGKSTDCCGERVMSASFSVASGASLQAPVVGGGMSTTFSVVCWGMSTSFYAVGGVCAQTRPMQLFDKVRITGRCSR